ncbi:TonB-dependent receptor [Candidatus Kapabacteria bacterium]|nr:TonB-dependent receptor [Candidatus Kapabacteria bacterium]
MDEIKNNKYQIYLIPKDFETEEVVVSASHWESNREKVPIKISNIEQSKVIIQNPQTAADLVGSSGEVFIQKSQLGGGSPMIRGFSANRVMITVDGVRMNNAIFRSGNLQNIISIDPFTVNNTELVFGPGSVLYGSDAIGGVMNFHTIKPKLKSKNVSKSFDINANTRFSTANNEKTFNINFNQGSENFAYLLSITSTNYGDQVMGSHGPREYLRNEFVQSKDGIDTIIKNKNPEKQIGTGYSQYNVLGKLLYQASDNLSLNLSYYVSASSDIPRYDRLIEYNKEQLKSGDWFYGPQVWRFANFTSIYSKRHNLFDEAKLTLAYQQFKESRNTRNFNDLILKKRKERVNAYSTNLDFYKKINPNDLKTATSTIYYGFELVYNEVSSVANSKNIIDNTTENIQTRYPDGSNWLSSAIYGNIKYEVNSELSIYSGVRINYISVNAPFDTTFLPLPYTSTSYNDYALNGSIGLAYRPSYDFQMNLNISTGFRAPNIDDIGKVFDSEPGSVVVPNSNISAELAYNFEYSVEKSFYDLIKIDLSAYYTILQNALVRRDFQFNGMNSIIYDGELSNVQAIQNAAKAQVYGVQGYLELKLPFNFAISSRLNYQVGEEKQNDGEIVALRHAAPMFGKTVLKYFYDKFRLELYAEYSDKFNNNQLTPAEREKDFIYALDSEGRPYSPSWYTLNLKGLYRINQSILVSAGLENITDQRYRPYSSGIAAPGINFIGALKLAL